MSLPEQDYHTNIKYVAGLWSEITPSQHSLEHFIASITEPRHYYIAVERDAVNLQRLLPEGLNYILVSKASMKLMQPYLQHSSHQSAQLELNSPAYKSAQLAIFASGHTDLEIEANYHDADRNLVSVLLPFKPSQASQCQCHIFLCNREPCQQNLSTRELAKNVRAIAKSLRPDTPNWCKITLTECLGRCTPGGTGLIYLQRLGQENHGASLCFTEKMQPEHWLALLSALLNNRPLERAIPSCFLGAIPA